VGRVVFGVVTVGVIVVAVVVVVAVVLLESKIFVNVYNDPDIIAAINININIYNTTWL
jgi:hypothetical protein